MSSILGEERFYCYFITNAINIILSSFWSRHVEVIFFFPTLFQQQYFKQISSCIFSFSLLFCVIVFIKKKKYIYIYMYIYIKYLSLLSFFVVCAFINLLIQSWVFCFCFCFWFFRSCAFKSYHVKGKASFSCALCFFVFTLFFCFVWGLCTHAHTYIFDLIHSFIFTSNVVCFAQRE